MKALCCVVALVLLGSPVAGQIIPMIVPEPQEYPTCDLPEPVLFASIDGTDLGFENLIFLNGRMYATAFQDGFYEFYTNGTHKLIPAEDRGPGPTYQDRPTAMMGLASVDGALFVSQGLSVVGPVDARILRFEDPESGEFTVYANGFDGANGMAADNDGNLYLAHGFREGIYKVQPDGSWDLWMTKAVANGVSLHPDGDRLVVGYVSSIGSRVITVPLDNPAAEETLFVFNAADPEAIEEVDPEKPLATKLVDDLVVGSDGMVYATAHERLQTIRGDPATGDACLVIDSYVGAPTSARIAYDFGEWDGWLFTTDNAGDIYAVDIRGQTTNQSSDNTEDIGRPESDNTARTPLPAWIAFVSILGLAAYTRLRRKP